MKFMAEYQKYNFFRRPDWRWERVLKMVDRYPTPGRSTKRDDAWVKDARNFILRWRNTDDENAREKLWMERPGLFYAYDFFARAVEEPEGAAFMEARILARQTPEQIAEAMGITPDTVSWYEALFFNVADKLQHRDWVTKAVLLPSIMKHHGTWQEATHDNDLPLVEKRGIVAVPFLDATMKLFAYFGGPHLVDIMITGFQQGKPLTSPDDLANWFDNHMASTVRRRVSMAAMRFEINKYNVVELLSVHTKIMEIERSEDNQDQQKTTTERHIKAMVDEIPWMVGDQAKKEIGNTVLGRLDDMASELRDDEVLRIAAGQPIPELADNFPKRLPPPPKRKEAHLLGVKEEDL